MKKILFEILNDIEPYQVITVSIHHDYWTLCREDAIFPLATCIKRSDSPFNTGNIFRSFINEETASHYENYDLNHTIEYNEKKILIEKEILDIKYTNEYIKLTTQNQDGINTNYINYNSIDFIKIKNVIADDLLEEYNKLQYEISINK